MYEDIRAALIDMQKTPKVTERTRLSHLVSSLSKEIRKTMNKGYTIADIAQKLHDVAGVDIKPKTLASYLHRSEQKRMQNVRSVEISADDAADDDEKEAQEEEQAIGQGDGRRDG